jgi:hypothetical protein
MRTRPTPISLPAYLTLVKAAESSPSRLGAVRTLSGALPPHTVVRDVRTFDGRHVATIGHAYDGTKAHAQTVAAHVGRHMADHYQSGTDSDDVTHAGSPTYATGASGKVVWKISPNTAVVTPVSGSIGHTADLGQAPRPVRKGGTEDVSASKPSRPEGFDAGKLPQEHGRYFHVPADAHVVPLNKITATRARPTGIANGEYFMHSAYHGSMGKRAPISLEHQGDGTYHVMDGNSTFAVAQKHGWDSLPAHVHEKGQWKDPKAGLHKSASPPFMGMPASAPPSMPASPPAFHASQNLTAAQQHVQSGPSATKDFTHTEMSLPHDDDTLQHTANKDVLYAHAAKHKEWMDHVIDRGRGVSAKLGLHVVEGRHPTEEDFAAAHQKGGMVVMAPLKGHERASEKAETKGWDGLRDLSRATIAVKHPDDIPHIMHHARKMGLNIAARPDYKQTDAGYQDVTVRPRHAETGHIGELQMMPLDMMQAKNSGLGGEHATPGHKLYEEMRSIKPEERELPENKARYEKANAQSNALYGEAVNRMGSRTPHFANALAKALAGYRRQLRQKHFVSPASQHGGHHPLRPGYYSYEGHPAIRATHAGSPRFWHNGAWQHVPDLGEFDHTARRITPQEFEVLRKRHNASETHVH